MQNIDIYYESIRQVYQQIVEWREPKPPLRQRIVRALLLTVGIMFTLSVIPILPAVFVLVGSRIGLRVGWLNLSGATVNAFVVVWGLAFVLGLLSLLLTLWLGDKVDSSVRRARPPHTLSPEQLTFLAVYEAHKELKVYFVSHIEQHVERSLEALHRALRPHSLELVEGAGEGRRVVLREGENRILVTPSDGDLEVLTVGEVGDRARLPRPSLVQQIGVARSFLRAFEKYAWLQLDSDTKGTLHALVGLSQKVSPRLEQKEDLPTVLSILESLSRFTYAYLPEHKTYMEPRALEALQAAGMQHLGLFVKEVNDLTPYSPPEPHKDAAAQPSRTLVQRLKDTFSESIFLRFATWFVLTLALTAVAVFAISRRLPLSPDTMATVIVGTSVASAATLAVFRPRSKGQD